MARPKLGEGESERLQMVITAEELEAIEEWRYQNLIPSKSEAIRRLCQIALFVDENIESILDLANDGVSTLSEHLIAGIELERTITAKGSEDLLFGRDEVRDLTHVTYEHDDFALHGVTSLRDMLLATYNGIAGLVNAKTFKSAQRALKQAIEEQDKRVKAALEEQRKQAENRLIAITLSDGAADRRQIYDALPEEQQEAYLDTWFEDLKREEEADPESFAKRYGIAPAFWEREFWGDYLKGKAEKLVSKEGKET